MVHEIELSRSLSGDLVEPVKTSYDAYADSQLSDDASFLAHTYPSHQSAVSVPVPTPAFLAPRPDRRDGFRQRLSLCLPRTRLATAAYALSGLAILVILYVLVSAYTAAPPVPAPRFDLPRGWGYSVDPSEHVTTGVQPKYDDPFNPDDLTFTEQQCDAYFPELYHELNRSATYYSQPEHLLTREYLEQSCAEPIWSHMRVLIHNNRLYIKSYRQSDFSRTQATLALLYQSLITAREPLPNIEFCIGLEDWPGKGKFGLTRSPDQEDLWLLPDYSFFSWPEHVGTYSDVRRRIQAVEDATPWEAKNPRLFWRGNMDVGKADRVAMAAAAAGHEWNDIKPVNWTTNENTVKIEDHCKWKFQGFADGNSYSGRLRYLQNCKTVIVTHRPRWVLHYTHLFNGNWSSPDQNVVLLPYPVEPGQAGPPAVKDEDPARSWDALPETMATLLADDTKARQIAETQYAFFRNRYVSPASATCYWRKAIRSYAAVQNYTVALTGTETSFESWVLRGMRDDTWRDGIQRRHKHHHHHPNRFTARTNAAPQPQTLQR